MTSKWKLGAWRVDLRRGTLSRRRGWRVSTLRPDGRLLRVLGSLLQHAGETVSVDELLASAWPDRVVGRDSVTTAIYQLRQLLEDPTEQPRYIASEARRGYRLIADVAPVTRTADRRTAVAASLGLIVAAVGMALMLQDESAYAGPVLVEPLLDLTDNSFEAELSTAIQSTFLSELIRIAPGRIRTRGEDSSLVLQSAIVQCDLGPAMVLRLLDTRSETFIWSQAYSMQEAAATTAPPTLVQQMAMDVGAALGGG